MYVGVCVSLLEDSLKEDIVTYLCNFPSIEKSLTMLGDIESSE